MEYQEIKKKVAKANDGISSIIAKIRLFPFSKDTPLDRWEKICKELGDQLRDDIFRISIVGAIKSGKSTLSNFLLQGDYLKRGAGIITSFITKVRKGDSLKAIIKLKSWEEINNEINAAIRRISIYENELRDVLPFDIRDDGKRERLSGILSRINIDYLLKDGTYDVNYLTISLYLSGYERVKGFISNRQKQIVYKGERFDDHKGFVGDDSLAIYLRDVLIEINTGLFDDSVEIADCQGSDSPNPMHLIMIQEYITLCQLIIYVISSRIGIREADIQFLNIIKNIGMLRNVIFVLNCDFDEHTSLDDMIEIIDRTRKELKLFVKNKFQLFAFSALFNLLEEIEKRGGEIKDKEKGRLNRWRNETSFVDFSKKETERFLEYMRKLLTEERYIKLIRTWKEKLFFLGFQIKEWIEINMDMILGDREKTKELIKKIEDSRKRLDKIRSAMKNSLEGAVNELKDRIKKEIDMFFDSSGALISSLKQFIDSFQIPYDRYMKLIEEESLSHVQYLIFRDYKESIDSFIVRRINPQIIGFIRRLDEKIKEHFISAIEAYYEMAMDVRSDISMPYVMEIEDILDIEYIKKLYKIAPPSIRSALEYSVMLGTETVLRFGIYRFWKQIKGILKRKKEEESNVQEKIRALEDGLRKIKKQAHESIRFNILNYKENLKYQYATALIDSCKQYILEKMDEYLRQNIESFLYMEKQIKKEEFDKELFLKEMDELKKELIYQLDSVKESFQFA